ncbi:MAG: helix-turn-helix transcriptional regulator [Clostridia bacterium]|nr:helix-turn-helix transcriptional regulator [Clostridia bacterium]
MKKSVYRIDLNETSESFYFLPKPQQDDAIFYLTSLVHEYPKRSYYIERVETDSYMILYTSRGSARFIYDGKDYTLTEGTLAFAYLGVHNILFPLCDDFEFFSFNANGAQIKSIFRHATNNGQNILLSVGGERITALYETLKPLVTPEVKFFEISKQLSCLLTDLLEANAKGEVSMPPLVHRVYTKIVSNTLSIKEIAAELGFTPTHLEREFKRHTGKTISRYIIERRLERAENLLLTTTLSVNEISRRVGYSDTVGLIHLFKKERGCTPLEFRKGKRGGK